MEGMTEKSKEGAKEFIDKQLAIRKRMEMLDEGKIPWPAEASAQNIGSLRRARTKERIGVKSGLDNEILKEENIIMSSEDYEKFTPKFDEEGRVVTSDEDRPSSVEKETEESQKE